MKCAKFSILPLTQCVLAIIIIVVVGFLALAHLSTKVGHDTFQQGGDASNTSATNNSDNSLIQGQLTVKGTNNQIGGSWLPHGDGNIYLRPKDDNKEVYVGDMNTKGTNLGTSPDVQYNRVGPHTWLPWTDGNSYIRPGKQNKEIRIGDMWTSGTRVGTGAEVKFNQVGQHTWLPYSDGNSYIRPGKDRGSIVVGDMWTDYIWMGEANRTNTVVRGMLKVNRAPTDKWPGGWGHGLHSWDVYANGTVAVGEDGGINSFMNKTTVSARDQLCVDGECINKNQIRRLKDLAK